MSGRDGLALSVSFGYVALVLAAAFLLRRARASPIALRAFVHAAVGAWIVPTVMLFETRWGAMVPPLVFVAANAVARPRALYAGFGKGDTMRNGVPLAGRDWGLVFFPASVAVCLALWWSPSARAAVVTGVLCLAWGDPTAALVGRRWGRHTWKRVQGSGVRCQGSGVRPEAEARCPKADTRPHGKTVEGSAALWLVGAAVTAGALVWQAGFSVPAAVGAGAAVGAAGALAEAVTPGRFDNVSLPLVTAGVAWLFLLGRG